MASDKMGIVANEGTANVFSLKSNVPVRSFGLLMARERGIPNKPTFIASAKEDVKLFGGHNKAKFYGSYVVKNLFDNLEGGNLSLYGVRIIGSTSVAASGTLTNTTTVLTVKAGREGQDDPGTWGNNLVAKFSPAGFVVANKVYCEVLYGGVQVETFTADTLALLADKINAQSGYIKVVETNYATGLPAGATTTVTLSGGTYVDPVDADFEPGYDGTTGLPEGLALFEGVPVNILACTEVFSDDYAGKANDYCAAQKFHYIHNAVEDANEAAIIATHTALKKANQSYVTSYLNWCLVDDGGTGKVWIPALGYFLGAGYARVSTLDNDVVWSVPAGDRTYAVGIYEFSHADVIEANITRYAVEFGMNAVMYVNNIGNIIWSQRTHSLNDLYVSTHVRLETNWLIKVLKERHVKYMNRLITPKLNNDIYVDNKMFFQNLYNTGGVESSIDFAKAVVIEVETNKINRKETDITIAWIPPENNEFVKIQLNRNDGVLSVTE